MINTPLSVIRVAAFCLPLALVASCGTSTEAVPGTTMNIDPPALGQATTLGTAGVNVQYYRVEAKSPTGYPQIGITVLVDSQYVVFEGTPTISCSGTTIATCTSSAPPLVLPHQATTDSAGTYNVTVLYDWPSGGISGAFTALQAWSGTGYGKSDITFTCSDPDSANPPDCP